jgi:integrase
MGGAKRGTGVRPRGDAIELDFTYRRVRCREVIKRAANKANLKWAEALRNSILDQITLGTFRYERYFPDSPRAIKFGGVYRSKTPVETALQNWLQSQRGFIAHSTYDEYRKDIKRLSQRMGDMALGEVQRGHVKTLMSTLASEALSRKRIANLLIPLRRLFDDALEDGVIDKHPFSGIKFKSLQVVNRDKYEPDPFSYAEMRAILEALQARPTVQAMFQFALWTGMRPSEYTALQWSDIDMVSSPWIAHVRRANTRGEDKGPKTEAGRRKVELLEPAVKALQVMKAHTYLTGKHIFLNPVTQQPWKSEDFARKRYWTPALQRAKVRHRPLYQCRHTFASMMLSEGEPLAWVSRQLGHANVIMTASVYAKWIPDNRPGMGSKAVEAWKKGA